MIVREGHEPLEVQTDNRDLLLYERTSRKHRWPTDIKEAPFGWLTFISWAAARRTGAIDGALTYERWESEVLQVESVDDDETSGDDGRPFEPEAEPGSL